jgi:hypothetical protein
LKHLGVKSELEDEEDKDEVDKIDLEFIQQKIDCLSKELYQRLINWIVFKINNYFLKISVKPAVNMSTRSNSSNSGNSSQFNNQGSSKSVSFAATGRHSRKLVLVDMPSSRENYPMIEKNSPLGTVYDLSVNYINDNLSCAIARDSLKLKPTLNGDDSDDSSEQNDNNSTIGLVINSTKTWMKNAIFFKSCLDAKPNGLLGLLDYYSRTKTSGKGRVDDVAFLIAAIDAQTNLNQWDSDPRPRGLSVKGKGNKCGFYSLKNGGFVVSHTTGDMAYAVKGILASNLDYSEHVASKLDSVLSRHSNSNEVAHTLMCKEVFRVRLLRIV